MYPYPGGQQGTPYPPQGQPGYPPNPNQQIGFTIPGQGQCPYPSGGQSLPPTGLGQGYAPYPPQGGGSPYPPQPGYPPVVPGYPNPGAPQYPGAYPTQPQQGQYPSPYPASNVTSGYPASPYGQPPPQQAYPVQQQSTLYPSVEEAHPQQHQHQHHQPPTMAQQHYHDVPSIHPSPTNPSDDAQVLRKAMKGFGTDEKAIISVLTRRPDLQRQQIVTAYKASFGKDLLKDLKSETGGKFEDVLVALMTPRVQLLAEKVKKAVSGLGTDEALLVDVLCTSTNAEIHEIRNVYLGMFGTPLEHDLKGDTSGHFRRLLVSLCQGMRNEEPYVNQEQAGKDAQELLNAGEKRWGTDESTFNMILATRSYPHLRSVFMEYERLTGHDFQKAIDTEFSGDVHMGMSALVKCAKNRAAYFAERLNQSLAGMGTNDNDLIFLMVTRADVDLGSVAEEYNKMYGKSLANDISGDTSGDYKKALLGLLGL